MAELCLREARFLIFAQLEGEKCDQFPDVPNGYNRSTEEAQDNPQNSNAKNDQLFCLARSINFRVR